MKQYKENDLPEGWTEIGLDQILQTLESGSRPKGGVREIKEGVPSIGGEHINENGGFRFEAIKFVPRNFFKQMNHGQIQTGDILIVKDGATTGKVALVREDFPYNPAVVNEHVFICRPVEGVYPPFLFHFLFSKGGQDRILENFRGSAQGGINQSFAQGTTVPLAPLPEQKRIVTKVGDLLARVNSAKERLNKVSIILKRLRQAVLSAACSGRLTADWREYNKENSAQELVPKILNLRRSFLEINRKVGLRTRYKEPIEPAYELEFETPDTWCLSTVDQLTLLVTKGSSPKWQGFEYTDGGLPFIRSQNVLWGNLDLSDVAYLPPVFNKSHKNSIIHQGDILLNLVGASVGRCTIATQAIEGANCNQAVAIIRLVPDGMLNKFLVYFLLSPYAQEHIHETKADVARANFNLDDIRPMVVPVPPLSEQQEIVRRVEAMFKVVDTVENRVEAAKVRAERLTQAILAKAFRGELVPTEAELARREGRSYESASELLARIKTARETSKKPESGQWYRANKKIH